MGKWVSGDMKEGLCSALLGPLQGRSGKNFLLDVVGVEFGGLRKAQSFVQKMRVDVHFSHFLVLLCVVLTEIKESFQ